MPRANIATIALLVVLLSCSAAFGAITVTIESISPSDGVIGEGGSVVISWTIETDDGESGDWQFEIEGDGTWDSGDPASSADASGDFSGTTTTGSSTILALDLDDGDGDYTVYLIAEDSSDSTNTDYASTTITLDTPPDTLTGVYAGGGDGRIFLEWDEPDDTDIDFYLVYYSRTSGSDATDYDGTDAAEGTSPIATGSSTNAIVSGLENGVRYYFRVSAVDESDLQGPLSEEVSAIPVKTQGVTETVGEEGGCFIATACFGNIDHPTVRIFRKFRDNYLVTNTAGQWFVDTYYENSPPFATWLRNHSMALKATRTMLVPLAWYAGASLKAPALTWMIPLLLLFMIMAPAFSYAVVRVRRRDK